MRSLSRGWTRILGIFVMLLLIGGIATACTTADEQGQDGNRKTAVRDRESNYDRAEARWPAPTGLSNFPMREALVKMTERQDLVNHPWYTYLMTMNGQYIGYFVTETYPQSSCNFLSSTERFVDLPDGQWGAAVAPSYDGIFYGGGGSSAACESMFFFDKSTNAMITFGGPVTWITSDAPLMIDVPQLQLQPSSEMPADGTPSPSLTPTSTP